MNRDLHAGSARFLNADMMTDDEERMRIKWYQTTKLITLGIFLFKKEAVLASKMYTYNEKRTRGGANDTDGERMKSRK